MQDLRRAALETGGLIETIIARGLEALARGEAVQPAVVRLLLRGYALTGRVDLEEAVGSALAVALDGPADDESKHPDWLVVFVEASSVSDDERLRDAARALEAGMRRRWAARGLQGPRGFVAPVMRSIDACLRAADLHPDEATTRLAIVAAVDELERVVGPRYRPGLGLVDVSGASGDLNDHVSAASALLTAFERTGRLPYSMLAEELLRFALRTPVWDAASVVRLKADATVSDAVGVLCRMAVLHQDAAYRDAAVIAPESNYASEAERLLNLIADYHETQGIAGGPEFGVAMLDWLALPDLK